MSIAEMIKNSLACDWEVNRFVPYVLKGVHCISSEAQYMDASNNTCLLCNQQFGDAVQHVRDIMHETRYFQLAHAQKAYVKNERERRLQQCEDVLDRIDKIKSAPQKSHLNDLTLQFIVSPLAEKDHPPGNEEKHRWDSLNEMLTLYEAEELESTD